MNIFILLIMLCYICAEDVLEKCECGLSSHFFEERSFGSFPHSFPFSGQIRVSFTCNIGNKSEKKVKKCSAIIIDEKFIISAKHYVLYDPTDFGDNCQTTYAEDERNSQTVNGESYHVKTNISFLATSNVTEVNEENLFTIENIFPLTEQYNSLELVMLELSENMTFSMDLRAACIYGGYTPKTGDVLRFAGFGRVVDVTSSRWPTAGDSLISTDYVHQLFLIIIIIIKEIENAIELLQGVSCKMLM